MYFWSFSGWFIGFSWRMIHITRTIVEYQTQAITDRNFEGLKRL